MKHLVRITAAVTAASMLSACGGGGTANAPALEAAAPLPPAPVAASSGFVYDTTALRAAHALGTAKVGRISVDLVPRMPNASSLLTYAANVNDPHNVLYRHFLTPQEIGDRYGASASDYAAAVKYLQAQGLSVRTWPQRMLLEVSGPQTKVESALNTKFAWYQNGNSVFLAPATAPKLPYSVPIVGATNIVMRTATMTSDVRVSPNGSAGDGILYGYTPQQIATAFDYNGAYQAGFTGKGINVGVIGTGGFSPADVPAYKKMFHIGGSGTAQMIAGTDADNPGNSASGFSTPPPITKPCPIFGASVSPTPTCNPEDAEVQIDTEQVAGLAYDANVRFYLAYNGNDGCGAIGTPCPPGAGIPLQGLGEVDAEIQTAIADNASDVLSLSFGGAEDGQVGIEFNGGGHGLEPLEFAALVSEGVAIFVSSGDNGAEQCQNWGNAPSPDSLCVAYPSTDPNVVSVGGTNTPVNSAGAFVGPLTGWGLQTTGGYGGSGGGVSKYFLQSAYQKGAPGVTGSMRNVPDVALNGDAATGVAVLMYGDPKYDAEAIVPYGGTSVAAPEMAAMWALVLQACKSQASCATAGGTKPYRLGNPNAFFYKEYKDAPTYAQVFYDVLYGDNAQQNTCQNFTSTPCPIDSGYNAGTGYDLITGIGAPYARALIKAVVGV